MASRFVLLSRAAIRSPATGGLLRRASSDPSTLGTVITPAAQQGFVTTLGAMQQSGFQRDCTYGKLAAMRLPKDVEGLGCCEYTMERGVVHACHAGGVVHCLEGWDHHEVSVISVVWKAAFKHSLTAAP